MISKRSIYLMLMTCLLLAGCSSGLPSFPPVPQVEVIWPDPTLPPRIQWLGEIRTPEDAGLSRGFLNRIHDFIFGRSQEQILRPYGVYADGTRIVLADPGLSALHDFDLERGNYRLIGAGESPVFSSPIGITSDARGNLYLTDSADGRIYRLSPGLKVAPLASPHLKRPTGIAYNPFNALLYVSDTVEHQVVALDLSGQEKFRLGRQGAEGGELNYPTDLWIDDVGQLYVTDALNSRIQVFSPEGAPRFTVGERGDHPGHLNKPKGVATDREGWIYVCDALQDSIQVFDSEGSFLFSFGSRGQGAGELWMPAGITIDDEGLIYVSDVYNRRIQVFRRLYK